MTWYHVEDLLLMEEGTEHAEDGLPPIHPVHHHPLPDSSFLSFSFLTRWFWFSLVKKVLSYFLHLVFGWLFKILKVFVFFFTELCGDLICHRHALLFLVT